MLGIALLLLFASIIGGLLWIDERESRRRARNLRTFLETIDAEPNGDAVRKALTQAVRHTVRDR
jgi:hypothetical protein